MRLVVDKMPSKPSSCLFTAGLGTFDFWWGCRITDKACDLDRTGRCPFLIAKEENNYGDCNKV